MSELETQNNNETPGPGAIVSYAREQLGISSADLAAELKITKHKLHLIEQNAFEQVGTPTFVRGYLRNAARILQLDIDMLLAEYEAYASDSLETDTEEEPSASLSSNGGSFKAIWALPILLLFVAVWWFAQGSSESDKSPAIASVEPKSADQQSAASKSETGSLETNNLKESVTAPVDAGDQPAEQDEAAESVDTLDRQPEEPQMETAAIHTADTTSPIEAAEETAAAVVSSDERNAETVATSSNAAALAHDDIVEPAEGEKVLVFRFNDSCWLQVRDATGKRLYSNTKEAGQQLRLQGPAPFRVNLGNVRAVELEVDGEAYPLEARAGRKTLAITIP
ncbi:RodZ domain-containing protein [Pseudoteredinibacter isoporae]|uniref:Cytoskeleton protein RodZ n=1 Tax=Pseudoteredinibacter isoporae TaxID=570281 RepID=A0A7X0JXL4_9GAMM|nr:RodZ domain-containing protein [Pseudoteredinibacter isoporae]MBB6523146.1 cytoskeleton protein RodZ [Pseudoteredinibacter isoporae]NHO88665.1 helix-turn-helix domain-containing protein [Pseudoteredinibacter isoporae]NIB22644.1 helix-turn-helix domain-containing protein [Pseudoteredinibacter isoporae]